MKLPRLFHCNDFCKLLIVMQVIKPSWSHGQTIKIFQIFVYLFTVYKMLGFLCAAHGLVFTPLHAPMYYKAIIYPHSAILATKAASAKHREIWQGLGRPSVRTLWPIRNNKHYSRVYKWSSETSIPKRKKTLDNFNPSIYRLKIGLLIVKK